jgi:3-deoxy-D-manno-octulosonic-acid transferase
LVSCSIIGEYEQDCVIEKIKQQSSHKIVLTFFHQVTKSKKTNAVADVTVYLWTQKKNAQQFLDLIHPDMVFFIKYEYCNYLNELKKRKTYLISGILKKTKLFLNGTGFLEKHSMLYLLFQNESSKIYTLGKQMLQSG